MQGEMQNESRNLAASNVFSRNYRNGVVFPVPGRLRKNIRLLRQAARQTKCSGRIPTDCGDSDL
jgi:hypothetical protein